MRDKCFQKLSDAPGPKFCFIALSACQTCSVTRVHMYLGFIGCAFAVYLCTIQCLGFLLFLLKAYK